MDIRAREEYLPLAMKRTLPKGILPESEMVEWKQSLSEWREIVETCAAFATAKGGTIYVGVSPKGERVGVQIGQGSLEDLANKIKVNTDPPQFPSIVITGAANRSILEIRVDQSTVKPVWGFGRPIKRVGRTNQFLHRDEAHRLLEVSTGRTWDSYACEGFTDKDIHKKAVKDFLRRAGMKISTPVDDVIKNLKLLSHHGYTHAAALLFGKRPQRFHVEAQTKCARFKGTTSVHFIDERTFEGPILEQLDNAMDFVTRNTRQAIVITGKPAHDVVPEYPEEAVREAITNALCHRNYADAGTIQVRISDDCLEVWNPGSLPHGISVQSLYHQHRSSPRNVLIAGALFRARLIEHWGTGTLRIIDACREHNIKVEFENEANTFIVRLRQLSPLFSAQPPSEARSVAPVRTQVGTKSALSRHQVAILRLCQAEASLVELMRVVGRSDRTKFRVRFVRPLLEAGLLEMIIPDKPNSRLQKYRLTARGSALLGR